MAKDYLDLDALQESAGRDYIDLDAIREAPSRERPTALQAVAEPFKRVAQGLIALPGAVKAGIQAIPEVDWRNLTLRDIASAGAETFGPSLPEMGGAAVGAFAGPAGLVAGPVAARLGYENIKQLMTGEPQEPLETLTRGATAGAGMAVPLMAGRAAKAAIAKVPRVIPGGSTALQAEGAEILKTAPQAIGGRGSARLYAAYEELTPPAIRTTNLEQTITRLGTKEMQLAKGLQEPQIRAVVEGLEDILTRKPTDIGLEQLRSNLSEAGKAARALEETNPRVAGALKKIFESGWKDIEAAAEGANPAAQLLKQANRAYRKEMAAETLKDWIEGTEGKGGAIQTRPADGLTFISPGKVLDKIRRNEFFQKSLDPGELNEITKILESTTRYPALPRVRGAYAGSAILGARAGTGYGAGYLAGLDPYSASALGGALAAAPEIISWALMRPAGRRALTGMLNANKGAWLTPQQLGLLGQLSGFSAGSVTRQEIRPETQE